MIEEMCKHVEKPLVFPLSNPTSQAEITAENAYKYSKGKCIFAGGQPPKFRLCSVDAVWWMHKALNEATYGSCAVVHCLCWYAVDSAVYHQPGWHEAVSTQLDLLLAVPGCASCY